ncbi:hypothetical protein F0562_021978 [Nyssa sinensis]|uniref:RING-type E3 ubiquitin transferase n=1 Tax=Nyssa sinensis TaxID=561372 RepID=A0A5J5BL35_9ASTE|nr:hypothetical protein F0562_021978 [Nyssa sinensis]
MHISGQFKKDEKKNIVSQAGRSTGAGVRMSSAASYWCYRCTRFVRVWAHDNVVCPYCDSGFVEAVDATASPDSPRRFPAAAMYMSGNNRSDSDRSTTPGFRRSRRNNADRSPFNPVIVLRGPAEGGGGGGE